MSPETYLGEIRKQPMCLAIPGKIVEVTDGQRDNPLARTATVDFQGSTVEASLAMTPQARRGDWVLVHAGFALTVMDEAQAKETWQSLQEVLSGGDDD